MKFIEKMRKKITKNKKIIPLFIIIGSLMGILILGLGAYRFFYYDEIMNLIERATYLKEKQNYKAAIELLRNAKAKAFTNGLKGRIEQELEEYREEVGKHKERIAKEKMGIVSSEDGDYKKDEIIVKYKKNKINLKTSTGNLKAANFANSKSITIKKNIKSINSSLIKIKDGKSVPEKIAELNKDPKIEYAEPNYVYNTFAVPDDPSFGELWGLNNTGQFVNGMDGVSDADIDAPEAWDITTGNSNVLIAVIDTGVDYNQPDLASNIWSNTGEVADNQVDDDGNGFVDDTKGWDFWSNDKDPMDLNGHGTHVAGTIAAVGDNTTGVTGVSWSAKIMPVRFLNQDGNGYLSDAILAIDYAVDNGAKILSNSWGGSYSSSLYDTLVVAKNQGVLVVAAAGNDACDGDTYWYCATYPAAYDLKNIISVAATDQNDNLAWFSTYGATSVDVAAPGKNIYSTVTPDRTVFWSDDVEGATQWTSQAPWTESTGASYSPTHAWRCPGQTGINSFLVLTNPLDLTNRRGTQLIYYTFLDLGLGPDDWLYVEASTDGTSWDLIDYPLWFSYDFEEQTADLSDYDGESTVYLRFRVVFEDIVPQMGSYVDDIQVLSYPAAPTENYDYYMGTSMATPHVSGLASLLLGYNSSLSWSDMKNLILWTGETKSSLSGKVLSGRRINANNSLNDPVIVDNYKFDGIWANSSPTITLDPIHAGGAGQISQVKYCTGTGCDPATGTVLFSPYQLFYSGTQNRIVRYQTWDTASDASVIGQYNVKLDHVRPTGTVVMNNNAFATNKWVVTLNLSASDSHSGVAQMRFSNNGSSWTSWINYRSSYSWNIISSAWGGNTKQGLKHVYAQFKDGAGNTSYTKSDVIIYDRTIPTGWIRINGGAYSTTSRYVTLYIGASDNYSGARWMKISNNGHKWTNWIYYKTRYYNWNLTNSSYGGNSYKGTKCVYIRFKDKAGNISSYKKDCIVFR